MSSPVNTQATIDYYADLLNLAYVGQPKAYATIQTLVTPVVMPQPVPTIQPPLPIAVAGAYNLNPTEQYFFLSAVPASGTFTLTYRGVTSADISGTSSLEELNTALVGFFGVGEVTAYGSFSGQFLTLTFNIDTIPGIVSMDSDNLYDADSNQVSNAAGTNQAFGHQLDVLGKYAGVTRTGVNQLRGVVTLSDQDYRLLIQMAIITNNSGSSLATIVSLLEQFFPGQIRCIDEANTEPMHMTYLISAALGSSNLLALFISEGLLPKPMGVGLSVIIPPTTTELFEYCDYRTATPSNPNLTNGVPYNCFTSYSSGDYNTAWKYLDYDDAIIP